MEQPQQLDEPDLDIAEERHAEHRLAEQDLLRDILLERIGLAIMVALGLEAIATRPLTDVDDAMDDRIRTDAGLEHDDLTPCHLFRLGADEHHDVPFVEAVLEWESPEIILRDVVFPVPWRLLTPPGTEGAIVLHAAGYHGDDREARPEREAESGIDDELDQHEGEDDIDDPARPRLVLPDEMPDALEQFPEPVEIHAGGRFAELYKFLVALMTLS